MRQTQASLIKNIAAVIIAVRISAAMTIDGHEYLNCGWLCAAIGTLGAIPFAFAADRNPAVKKPEGRQWLTGAVYAVFAVYMAYQAAAVLRLLINTISYSNLQNVHPTMISVILMIAGIYIVSKNGTGIGGAVKLMGIGICVMSLIVLLTSVGDMQLNWFAPVLGPGRQRIIKGALLAFGQMLSGILLVMLAEGGGRFECVKTVATGGVAATALCVYWTAMTPVQLTKHINRLTGIELLLSNGRTSLAALLPITVICFAALIMAMYGSIYGSAISIKHIFRNIKRPFAGAISAAAVFAAAAAGIAESDMLRIVSEYSWIFMAAALAVIFAGRRRRADEN